MDKPSKIYKNTMFLSLLSVLERALGFIYRVVLARLLGAEGLGVYQIAVSHFFLLRTLGGGGLPVTLSRTVAGENAQGKSGEKSLFASLFLSLCVTLPITLFTLLFAGKIPALSEESGALKILVFSLPFACAYAVIKGYFWGKKQFALPALIEFFEELVMAASGALLLIIFHGFSPMQGAKYAALAMSISCVFAATVSAFTLKKRPLPPRLFLKEAPPLFRAALPITAVRLCGTLVGSLSAVLLPWGLERAGYSPAEALSAFGVATGMVFPLLTSPLTVVGALCTVLVPELAEARVKGNRERLSRAVEKGLFFTLALTLGLLPFFYALAKPLCNLLYQVPLAGELLKRASFLLPLFSLSMLSQSFVNSLGYEKKTFLFSTVSSAVFLLLLLFLPKFLGIYAYLVALGGELLIGGGCSLLFLKKIAPPQKTFFKRSLPLFIIPLFLLPFSNAIQRLFALTFPEPLASLLCALAVLAVTALLYFLFGVFRKKR